MERSPKIFSKLKKKNQKNQKISKKIWSKTKPSTRRSPNFMMKLHLGSTFAELAQRFSVSITSASNVFAFWIKVLSNQLGCVVYNPSVDIDKKTLPKVRHIIDCMEISTEAPSDPALKAATWSDYKHHNTVKVSASVTCIQCRIHTLR